MKKIISLLIFGLIIGFTGVQVADAEHSLSELNINDIYGEVIQQGLDLQQDVDVKINKLNIHHENGKLSGSGSISRNGLNSSIILEGKLYPVLGEGYYAGRLIVGDIETNSDYNFLQFRVENQILEGDIKSALLTITLEHRDSGEWIEFSKHIDKNMFNTLYSGSLDLIAYDNLEEEEVNIKVLSLLNLHNKAYSGEEIKNSIQIEVSGSANSDGHFEVDKQIGVSWIDVPVNANELNRLFNDLNKPGISQVNLGNYNLPESLFKGTGWKQDWTFGQSPRWNYYARSVEQNDWTITQITMFQHDSRFLGFTESNNKHEIVLEYKHGMVLEYNHRTKNISVMYYDFGLTLRDWQIAQGALEGRNVYFAQELNGRNLTRRSGNIIRYFVSLIPNSERITDLWDQLRFDVNEELGQRYSFIGSNYDDQVRMHNGNVYRSVSGNLGQWEMSREGAHVNFTGDINAGERSISLRWSYRGNIASNL